MRRLFAFLCLLAGLCLPAGASAATLMPGLGATAVHPGAPARLRPQAARLHGRNLSSGTFFIRGGGDGHGIGMSQYGALGYAEHGATFQAILAHYYTGTALGKVSPTQVVRVWLAAGAASFSGASTAPSHTKLNPAWVYAVKPASGGQLAIVDPHGKTVGHFGAPLVVSGSGPLTVPGLGSYRGTLEFRPAGSGVQTVNAVGLDDYVRGVVADEMPSSWAAAALEAQAVAARTYAITTGVQGDGYSLYPDTRSQMYGGVGAETADTDAAVAATSGQVVTYNGQPAVTYFFASSGGYTESVQNVWSGATPEPWLVGVPDPYDSAGGDPYHSWGQTMSLAAAATRLGSLVKGQLIGIRVLRHGVSPRILEAAVVGTGGSTTVTGDQLAGIFGLATTYAAFTTIEMQSGLAAASHVPNHHSHSGGASLGAAVDALATLRAGLRALAAGAPRGVDGLVYPAPHRGSLAIQELVNGAWRTVGHAHVSASGSFTLKVGGPGRYRAVIAGLDGPVVGVR